MISIDNNNNVCIIDVVVAKADYLCVIPRSYFCYCYYIVIIWVMDRAMSVELNVAFSDLVNERCHINILKTKPLKDIISPVLYLPNDEGTMISRHFTTFF